MRRVLRNTGLPKKLRARFYVQGPLNKLLYGIESCALTKTLKSKLTAFHNKQARRIHGSTRWHHQHEKLKMETIFKELDLAPLDTYADTRIFKFIEYKLIEPTKKTNYPSIVSTVALCHATPKNVGSGRTPTTIQSSWATLLKIHGGLATVIGFNIEAAGNIISKYFRNRKVSSPRAH